MSQHASPADWIFALNVLCVVLWICIPRVRRPHRDSFSEEEEE